MARNEEFEKDPSEQESPDLDKKPEKEEPERHPAESDTSTEASPSDDQEQENESEETDKEDEESDDEYEDDEYEEEDEDEDEEDDNDKEDEVDEEDRELVPRKQPSGFFKGFFVAAGAFLAAAAIFTLFFFNIIPNPFPGCLTAISFGNYNVSVSKYEFFYNFYAGQYANQYTDIDLSKSLYEQTCSIDNSKSWGDYISTYTESQLKLIIPVSDLARKEGIKLSTANQDTYDGFIQNIYDKAESNGITSKELIQKAYGKHVTKSSLLKAIEDILLATQYQDKMMDSYEFTKEEIADYYGKNKANFDLVSFNFYSIPYDGKTVTQDAAKTKAEAFASKAQDAAAFAKQAYEYASEEEKTYFEDANATLNEDLTYDSIGIENVRDWLYDDTRKAGDTYLYDYGQAYWIFLFRERKQDVTPTVNVRNILIQATDAEVAAASIAAAVGESDSTASSTSSVSPDSSASSTSSGTTSSAASSNSIEYQDTYKRAQAIFDEWKQGDKTEDSFAALAKKYSEDEESKNEGGLMKNVTQSDNAFGAWCFDPARKSGDTTIMPDSSVFYILYYVSQGEQSWELAVKTSLAYLQYQKEVENLYSGLTVKTDHLGHRYISESSAA